MDSESCVKVQLNVESIGSTPTHKNLNKISHVEENRIQKYYK